MFFFCSVLHRLVLEMMNMKCAWAELLAILPQWLRPQVDQVGRDELQELRLRINYPPELVCSRDIKQLSGTVTVTDLHFVINTASGYSPWSADTISQGYLTPPGGHRIGVCGEAVIHQGHMTGIRTPSSLCIRVAKDFPGIGSAIGRLTGSVLIIGRPGSGKTTLLRDLIRIRSQERPESIAVVDERREVFPQASGFSPGPRTDVLHGCSKEEGIDILLRTMGPGTIAVDEITCEKDCTALMKAGWCGVDLLATAHASSRKELYARPVYQPLVKSRLFDHLVILHEDKSCTSERMER